MDKNRGRQITDLCEACAMKFERSLLESGLLTEGERLQIVFHVKPARRVNHWEPIDTQISEDDWDSILAGPFFESQRALLQELRQNGNRPLKLQSYANAINAHLSLGRLPFRLLHPSGRHGNNQARQEGTYGLCQLWRARKANNNEMQVDVHLPGNE